MLISDGLRKRKKMTEVSHISYCRKRQLLERLFLPGKSLIEQKISPLKFFLVLLNMQRWKQG